MPEQEPSVYLTLRHAVSNRDLIRFAALARQCGFEDGGLVSLNYAELSIRAFLDDLATSDEIASYNKFLENDLEFANARLAELEAALDVAANTTKALASDSSTSSEEAKSEVARLTAEVDQLTKERDEWKDQVAAAAGWDHKQAQAAFDEKLAEVEAERDKAQSEMQEMIHLVHRHQKEAEKQARLAAQAKDDLVNARKVTDKLVKDAENAAERHLVQTVNSYEKQLKAAKDSHEKIIVGDDVVIAAISKLVIAIKAHQMASHGGRMQDSGDQILYDTCTKVVSEFGLEQEVTA